MAIAGTDVTCLVMQGIQCTPKLVKALLEQAYVCTPAWLDHIATNCADGVRLGDGAVDHSHMLPTSHASCMSGRGAAKLVFPCSFDPPRARALAARTAPFKSGHWLDCRLQVTTLGEASPHSPHAFLPPVAEGDNSLGHAADIKWAPSPKRKILFKGSFTVSCTVRGTPITRGACALQGSGRHRMDGNDAPNDLCCPRS